METKIDAEQIVEGGFDRVRDAAKFLGISVSQVYLLMDRGELRYAKFGRSRRIPHRALIEFAARSLVVAE